MSQPTDTDETMSWPQAVTMSLVVTVAIQASGVFAGIVFIILGPMQVLPFAGGWPPPITIVLVTIGLGILPILFVIRSVLLKATEQSLSRLPEPDRPHACPGRFFQQQLVSAALLEGGAMACLVAYFLEGTVLALVSAGGLLALIATLYPTARVRRAWLARFGCSDLEPSE